MKTCPACHRSVPDHVTTCPHGGCGHLLDAPHTSIKRPPPPPTRIQVTGANSRGASSPTAAKQLSSKEPKPWRWPLVLLATILLTSVLTAALTAFLLRGGQTQQVAVAKAIPPQAEPQAEPKAATKAAEPAAQQPLKKPAAAHVDEPSKPPQPPASPAKKDGATENDGAAKQDGAVSPPKIDAPLKNPGGDDAQQPLGLAEETRKTPTPDPVTGLVDDPRPDPLTVPDEPELPVVADTPEGLYAARTKPKTAEFLAERGGTIESQKAVEDGLNWLARHQGANGHWGADCLGPGPSSRCNRKAPCRVPGWTFDVAHTGLALLAFQAAGHYHFNDQKYSRQVNRGIAYLLAKQSLDGSFVDPQTPNPEEKKAYYPPAPSHVGFMYEHAIATFAVCEACALAIAEGKKPNPRLQLAAQRAVSYIESIQHDDGGWRYHVNRDELSDCSVSGWVMLALKTAREAKLNVSPEAISRMMEFIASLYADSRSSYQFQGGPSSDSMTAVGMMAVEFFEHKLDSPIVQRGVASLLDQNDSLPAPLQIPVGALGIRLPDEKAVFRTIPNVNVVATTGYYLWYNCTMAMFQVGGEPWKRWNESVRDPLIGLQARDVTKLEEKGLRVMTMTQRGSEFEAACERGSWSPDHEPTYGDLGGRIYSTALAVLTLEVYYRFQRVAGQPEKEKFFDQ